MHARIVRSCAVVLLVITALAMPATAAAARTTASVDAEAIGCYVEHRVEFSSATAYIAEVRITNVNLSGSIERWALSWTFETAAQIEDAWNATTVQAGRNVTAFAAPWNGVIPPGGTVKFGYIASGSFQPGPPIFKLNGAECRTWSPTPPATGSR